MNWQLIRMGRADLAADLARQALAHNPRDPNAHLCLAYALLKLRQGPEASAAAEAAIGLSPQWARAYCCLAEIRLLSNQLPAAAEVIAEALRLDPLDVFHHGVQAQILLQMGHYPEALAAANAGLQLDARATECLLWRALAYEGLNRPRLADQDFRTLLEIAPNSAVVRERLGHALLGRYRPAEASEHLAEALRLEPHRAPWLAPLLRKARLWQDWPRGLADQRERYQATIEAAEALPADSPETT